MLQRLADAGLVKGKTVGIDATTLEANAALQSIVRRDTGESYQDFLMKLARASSIETPTRTDLIVMAAQGSAGVELMLYGSNTHHVVRRATCPVLTVRE